MWVYFRKHISLNSDLDPDHPLISFQTFTLSPEASEALNSEKNDPNIIEEIEEGEGESVDKEPLYDLYESGKEEP